MVDAQELANLSQVRANLQAQQQAIVSQQQQASQLQQQLITKQQQEVSQTALRNQDVTSLPARSINLQNIKQSQVQIAEAQKTLQEQQGQLKQYEENVLTPYEQAVQREINFEQAQKFGNIGSQKNETRVINPNFLPPELRQATRQTQADINLNDKLNLINQGKLELSDVFTPRQISDLEKVGIITSSPTGTIQELLQQKVPLELSKDYIKNPNQESYLTQIQSAYKEGGGKGILEMISKPSSAVGGIVSGVSNVMVKVPSPQEEISSRLTQEQLLNLNVPVIVPTFLTGLPLGSSTKGVTFNLAQPIVDITKFENLMQQRREQGLPSGTISTIARGVLNDFYGGANALTNFVEGGVKQGIKEYKQSPAYPIISQEISNIKQGGLYKYMQSNESPLEYTREFFINTPSPQESIAKPLGTFFATNKSPQEYLSQIKGITSPLKVNVPIFSVSGGGNIPVNVPTPFSIMGDIAKAYSMEEKAGTISRPSQAAVFPLEYFQSKLGQGYREAGTGIAETYFQSARGKYVSPWISATNPNYQPLPESKIVGGVSQVVGQVSPYFIPVLSDTLIAAPVGIDILTGQKPRPMEVATLGLLGAARGYQFFKYATTPVQVDEGWITEPQKKPIKLQFDVSQDTNLGRYSLERSYSGGEYATVYRPRVYDWLGVSDSDITFVKDIQPKTELFYSGVFNLKNPKHEVGTELYNLNPTGKLSKVEKFGDNAIFTSSKYPIKYGTDKILLQPVDRLSAQDILDMDASDLKLAGREPVILNKDLIGQGIQLQKGTVTVRTTPFTRLTSEVSNSETGIMFTTKSKYGTEYFGNVKPRYTSQWYQSAQDILDESGIVKDTGRLNVLQDTTEKIVSTKLYDKYRLQTPVLELTNEGTLKPTGEEIKGYVNIWKPVEAD